MKNFFLLMLFFNTSISMAFEQKILTVHTNFPNKYEGHLYLITGSDHGIQGARYQDGNTVGTTYTLHDIQKGLDMIAIDELGIRIITLKGNQLDRLKGGPIEINFKRKFIGSDTRILSFKLKPELTNKNYLLYSNNLPDPQRLVPVDTLDVHIKTILGVPSVVDQVSLGKKGSTLFAIDTKSLRQ